MQRSLEKERKRERIITGKMTGPGKVTHRTTNRAQEDTFPQSTHRTGIPTQGRRHYSLNRGCPEVLFLGTVELGWGMALGKELTAI